MKSRYRRGRDQCEDEQKKERERERGNCPVVKLLFIYKSLKCSFCLLELTKRTRWNASSEVETFF